MGGGGKGCPKGEGKVGDENRLDPLLLAEASPPPLDPQGFSFTPQPALLGSLWASNCSTKLRLQLLCTSPSLRHRSFTASGQSPSQSWGGAEREESGLEVGTQEVGVEAGADWGGVGWGGKARGCLR